MRRLVMLVIAGFVIGVLPAVAVAPVRAAQPHDVFIKVDHKVVKKGAKVRIHGSVLPARARPVKLLVSTGGRWRVVKKAYTSSRGAYSFTDRARSKGTRSYRVCKIGGSARCSKTVRVRVRGNATGAPKTQPSLSVTSVASYELTTDGSYDIAGTASPTLVGKPVYLQLYSSADSTWSSISGAAYVAPDGTWHITAPANQAGRSLSLRVYAGPTKTTWSAATGLSPFIVYGWYYLDTFSEVAGTMHSDSLQINGVTYPRSVYVYSYFELNLSRACKAVTASMGLSDGAYTGTRYTATLTGDSRELYRRSDVKLGEMTPISIDVTGILRLRVQATFGSGDDDDPLIFGDARALCAY